MTTATKRCLRCTNDLNLDDFQKDKRGRRKVCKKCRRDSEKLLKKLHQEWKERNPHIKVEVCECCGERKDKLIIDHCHDTGEMRGWLCHLCNIGIGNLGDNLEGLQKAVMYLSRERERERNTL